VSLFSSFEVLARQFDLEAANWIRELDATNEGEGWTTHGVLEAAQRAGIIIAILANQDGSHSWAICGLTEHIKSWWDADGCATDKHPLNQPLPEWRGISAESRVSQHYITIEFPPLPPRWSYPWTMPFREGIRDWRTGELRRRK
jgi:hypothetical protein